MFRITGGKGFQITFDNGVTVSVQFGFGDHCNNKFNLELFYDVVNNNNLYCKCEDAEIAIMYKDKYITREYLDSINSDIDDVLSKIDSYRLVDILLWSRSYEPN